MSLFLSHSSRSFFLILFTLSAFIIFGCSRKTPHQPAGSIVLQDGENYFLSGVSDIQIDTRGNIYVFDTANPRVLKFDRNGEFLGLILGRKMKAQIARSEFPRASTSPAIAKLSDSSRAKLMHELNSNKLTKGLALSFKRGILLRVQEMPFPFEMKHFQGNKYVILSPVWYQQTVSSSKPSDAYFHIYNLKKRKLVASFGNQDAILGVLNYHDATAFLTNSHIGDALFVNSNTLLYAPFVYNGTMMVFQKLDNGEWAYESKVEGKQSNRPAFKPLYLHKSKRPTTSSIKTGRNIISFANKDGFSGGLLNSRSAGIFRLNNDRIVHFSIDEFKSKSDSSFYQRLYAEIFDNNLKYLGSRLIKKGKPGISIANVYGMGKGRHFFMVLQTPNLQSKVVEFMVNPPK